MRDTKRCVVALSAGGEHVEEKLDSVDVSLYSSNWFRGHIWQSMGPKQIQYGCMFMCVCT